MSDITALAELIRPDDTLRFKLFAQKAIVQDDARITVEVHALVSTAQNDRRSLEQKIRTALDSFISADWAFSTIQRGGEAVGYERVTLNASTRVPIAAYNRKHLENRLAYRIQELAYGGLKPATIKRLEELGEQLDGGNAKVRSRRVDGRPVAGTKLIREWQGTAHEVIIHVDHFEYEGRPYKSLSHIAKHITGTVWNGWAFFGLRKVGGLA